MKTQGAEKSSPAENGDSTFGSVFGEGDKSGGVGDFGKSTFGDTNAVGDIFSKAGAGGAEDKKKKMTLLGATAFAVLACLGLVWYLLSEDPSSDELSSAAPADQAAASAAADPAAAEPVAADPAATDAPATAETETPAVEAPAAEEATDAPAPQVGDTSSWRYDETKGGPVVDAKAGAVVEVSRSADFSAVYVSGSAKNGRFRIPNPPPGEIFWREQGSQSAHKISVSEAPKLQFNFSSPGTVAADGQLSWDASGAKVAFYRVEFSSDASFASPSFVVSTSKNSAAISGVSAGKYYVRIAGYNEQAGQWQFSKDATLEVQ